jgi:hypothetical protein
VAPVSRPSTLRSKRLRTPPPKHGTYPVIAAAIILIAVTASLWSSSLRFGFVYDDHAQIESNRQIQSWGNAGHLISEPLWSQLGKERASHYYRPLFSLLLLMQYSLFGLNPFGWHLVNVALHAGTVLALFGLLLLNLKSVVPAFCATLLFAVSPLHAEVVSWISASDESLCALFIVLSVCFLALSSSTRSSRTRLVCRIASSIMVTLALFTKETGVLAVVVLIGYELLVLDKRSRANGLVEYGLYLIPAAAYSVARAIALSASPPDLSGRTALSVFQTMPLEALLALRQLLWPITTSEFYDLQLLSDQSATRIACLLVGFCLVVTAFVCVLARSRVVSWILLVLASPIALCVGGLFYLRDYDLFHDRYLYLASIGLSLLVGFLVEKSQANPWMKGAVPGVVVVVCGLMALRAGTASQPYHDDLSLFRHAVEVAPHNIIAIDLLANAEMMSGLHTEAVDHYRHAEQLRPDLWNTNFHLGIAYLRTGQRDKAANAFLKAAGASETAARQTALAWYEFGLIRSEENDLAAADAALRRAEMQEPESIKVHYALAQVLLREGRLDEARIESLKATAAMSEASTGHDSSEP